MSYKNQELTIYEVSTLKNHTFGLDKRYVKKSNRKLQFHLFLERGAGVKCKRSTGMFVFVTKL